MKNNYAVKGKTKWHVKWVWKYSALKLQLKILLPNRLQENQVYSTDFTSAWAGAHIYSRWILMQENRSELDALSSASSSSEDYPSTNLLGISQTIHSAVDCLSILKQDE